MDIGMAIESLIQYGLHHNLIYKEDIIYIRNQILDVLKIEDYTIKDVASKDSALEEILNGILKYCIEHKMIEDRTTDKDLLDTRLMGILTPRPSAVIKEFWEKYKKSPEDATNYFYQFSQDTNYIRTDRIKKDVKWKYKTKYGELDITINLSKPEKDPKEIEMQKNSKASSYPCCLLCKENEGYSGSINYPARQNHRIIPISLNHEQWALQYSPYVYYKEHSIAFHMEHTPMKMSFHTFHRLLDFVTMFPHYFIGSNADLPIVGGSILSHDHYQAGKYEFTLMKAEIEEVFHSDQYKKVSFGIVKWPLSVVRAISSDACELSKFCSDLLTFWKNYSDPNVNIFAFSQETPHNTITPIARVVDGKYQIDLVLRNNRVTADRPFGLFHPHEKLHHIKKENIGLIEVMGLAVLPARLSQELDLIKQFILQNKDISENEKIRKHDVWVKSFLKKYEVNATNIDQIMQEEVGKVFLEVLECCGVFKDNAQGRAAFLTFLHAFTTF